MNYTTYTDAERVMLDAHRMLSRAKVAATAAAHMRRFADLTLGQLQDVEATTAAIDAANSAYKALLKAAVDVNIAKDKLECSVHNMKIEEANNV